MKKFHLAYVRLFSIALVILMKTKNHGVLETLTKIQFHHETLTWQMSTHWQIGHFSFQWNWTWMWPRSLTLWFNSNFWIYVGSGILTQVGTSFRANIYSCVHRSRIESPILENDIPLMGKECEIRFFDLDSTLDQNWLSNPKLIFRVSIVSRTYHS